MWRLRVNGYRSRVTSPPALDCLGTATNKGLGNTWGYETAFLFSYRHPESGFGGVGRPTWITIRSLYFEQNTYRKPFIKTITYNATSTNSHIDVGERLLSFPPVAHPTSGPNNRSSRSSYSHCPAVAQCDTDSPKRECSHWPSSSGVSPDSAYSLILFRYRGREKF